MPLNLVRKLTVALFISGALNIALLAGFFYWTVSDRVPMPYCELKPANLNEQQTPLAIDLSNADIIRCFKKMSAAQLVGRLRNTQLVENGYSQRDLALACLAGFHHFDLNRALAGNAHPEQKRTIVYGRFRSGERAELTIYPGLSEKQYESILSFAATERWPFTSQGLFLALRKQDASQRESTLCNAFYLTPEFLAVETLFSRAEPQAEKIDLLNLILEGDWKMLASFAEQQRASQDLSPAKRHRFLLDYIVRNSKSAARLMLKTDEGVAVRKLDDNQVVKILQLLEEKTPDAEKFARSLLTSPRSDIVWKEAAAKLYAYAGEAMPEKDLQHAALARFLPGHATIVSNNRPSADALVQEKSIASPVRSTPAAVMPQKRLAAPAPVALPPANREFRRERLYVVQHGDSLWKISKRFNVDVDRIKACNKLETDFLKPGRPLLIPN